MDTRLIDSLAIKAGLVMATPNGYTSWPDMVPLSDWHALHRFASLVAAAHADGGRLIADRDMLRDALIELVAVVERRYSSVALHHALEDAKQAIAQTIDRKDS